MKITFLTSGRYCPSSRYRILQYLPYFKARGHECHVYPSIPAKYKDIKGLKSGGNNTLRRIFRYLDYWKTSRWKPDLIYLEREIFSYPDDDIERLFLRLKIPFVVDIDDGVFLMFPDKYRFLLENAALAVTGSEDLSAYCRQFTNQIAMIPTSIELNDYPHNRLDTSSSVPVILGWTGTAYNLNNFALIAESLKQLATLHPIELHVIAESTRGLSSLDLGQLKVCFHRWRETTEIRDLLRFDIGLMPLYDTDWNRYKCGLKIIQYMGVGIPAVASPVGANQNIIQSEKNGLLASTPAEWTSCLEKLIQSPTLRKTLGEAGRATAVEKFSVERNYPLLEAALASLCQ